MELEDFFDFLAADDIRLRGSRIGIESVLYEYLYRHKTAEQIAARFPSLRLEQVYATILYYLHNREKVQAYVQAGLDFSREMREKQEANPSPVVLRLRKLKAERARETV